MGKLTGQPKRAKGAWFRLLLSYELHPPNIFKPSHQVTVNTLYLETGSFAGVIKLKESHVARAGNPMLSFLTGERRGKSGHQGKGGRMVTTETQMR